jgi:uncharacterized protein (DUF169 family)
MFTRLLTELASIGLGPKVITVTYADTLPDQAARFEGSEPSGCSFWRLAAEGQVFYTEPADHYNCPVGSFTHNVPLPPEREREVPGYLGLEGGFDYSELDDVPGIFRLPETPRYIIYAPLQKTSWEPSVVVIAGTPRAVGLVMEAAMRAGICSSLPMLGRPTCMALPAAMASGTISSGACIGNRVYTSLGDDEMYIALPGTALARIAAELPVILSAMSKLESYHKAKRQTLATQ